MHRKIYFLDGLRGIAAFYVMTGHARWLLWEGYSEGYLKHGSLYTPFDKFCMYFLSLFKWGHEFVLLFFVLSGFVIHLGYAKKLSISTEIRMNIKEYLVKRIKRIYPPFLLAIFLTMLLDVIGRQLNNPILSGSTPYALINQNIGHSDHSIKALVGNFLFVYSEYVPLFGTNNPAWSLKFEWWFYILYIPFLYLARKNFSMSTILIVGLFILSFFENFWFEPLFKNVFGSMLCWWLGVLIAEAYVRRIRISLLPLTCVFFIGFATLFLAKVNKLQDLRTAFLFSGILCFLLWYNNKGYSLKFFERLKPLGDFSYTLYIIHFPILVFLSGLVMRSNNNFLPKHSGFVFLTMAICLVLAYLLHFIVEVPFTRSFKSRQQMQKYNDVEIQSSVKIPEN